MTCNKCGGDGPFHPSYPTRCKACLAKWQRDYRARQKGKEAWERTQRRYTMRKRYGLEPEEYEALWADQDGRCAICRTSPDVPGTPLKHRVLHIDHDHATGAVRGLLCNPCNRALGYLRDSPLLADNAAAYLRRGKDGMYTVNNVTSPPEADEPALSTQGKYPQGVCNGEHRNALVLPPTASSTASSASNAAASSAREASPCWCGLAGCNRHRHYRNPVEQFIRCEQHGHETGAL